MRRIILLLASMALAVIIGSGVALADSPTTKEDCKNGGYAKYGFKNQGQCLKAVTHATPADTTPPETNVPVKAGQDPDGRLNERFNERHYWVHINEESPTDTFECRILGYTGYEDWHPCVMEGTPPDAYPSYRNIPNGSYTFELRAKDAAGNVDPTPFTDDFLVDPGPDVTVNPTVPRDLTTEESLSWTYSSDEPNTTFMCEFLTVEQWQQRIEDNGGSAFGIPYNFTPCPEDEDPNTEGRQFVVEPQPPGQYILIVRGINEAGHFRDPPKFSSIFVHQAPDTTAPRTDA